jgi:Leucine-rich repeat (LRR) protein
VSGTERLIRFTAVNNNISTIVNGTFTAQSNITVITLNTNRIEEIEQKAFNGLQRLEKLSFIGNNLNNIPNGLFNDTSALEL